MNFVAVSHAIYLPETQFQVALRTVTKIQHYVARQEKRRSALRSLQ
ncbi:hypothetical protein [Pilibacter termitis]|nr:hypothetical protein [Pilibacter termitis]